MILLVIWSLFFYMLLTLDWWFGIFNQQPYAKEYAKRLNREWKLQKKRRKLVAKLERRINRGKCGVGRPDFPLPPVGTCLCGCGRPDYRNIG